MVFLTWVFVLCASKDNRLGRGLLVEVSTTALARGSELRIEVKPPRHKGTKTRIEEILLQSELVTSCLGDLVVNLFQSRLLTPCR
jgi:hypothetical protein